LRAPKLLNLAQHLKDKKEKRN